MFSVLVPCYRPDLDQLWRCLGSIVSQLPLGSEVILLHDAHPHGSGAPSLLGRDFPTVNYVTWEEDLGGCRTVNRGIELASEEYIHVCHPDDWVLPGFYEHVAVTTRLRPRLALYATQAVWCDGAGVPTHTPRPLWLKDRHTFQPLHLGNPLCVAGCVVRRSFVQEFGGWRPELIHTADWEMWARAATLGGACAIDWPLCCHTEGEGNHTSRLMRAADNLRDYLRLADVVKGYMPVDLPAFRRYVAARARAQEAYYRSLVKRDEGYQRASGPGALVWEEAAEANARLAEELEATA